MELDVSFKGVEQTQLYSFLQLGVIKKNNMKTNCKFFLFVLAMLFLQPLVNAQTPASMTPATHAKAPKTPKLNAEQRAKIFNEDSNQCLFQNENIENGNHISYDAVLILIHKTSN